jgi:hypothetical protein
MSTVMAPGMVPLNSQQITERNPSPLGLGLTLGSPKAISSPVVHPHSDGCHSSGLTPPSITQGINQQELLKHTCAHNHRPEQDSLLPWGLQRHAGTGRRQPDILPLEHEALGSPP